MTSNHARASSGFPVSGVHHLEISEAVSVKEQSGEVSRTSVWWH